MYNLSFWRQGEFDDYEYDDHDNNFDDYDFDEYDNYDGLGELAFHGLNKKPAPKASHKTKSQVNAMAVLGMIKNLQDEIQVY